MTWSNLSLRLEIGGDSAHAVAATMLPWEATSA